MKHGKSYLDYKGALSQCSQVIKLSLKWEPCHCIYLYKYVIYIECPIYIWHWTSLVVKMVKNLPAMQETWVQSLVWEDLLERGMATHSNILARRIPWTEKSGDYSPWGPIMQETQVWSLSGEDPLEKEMTTHSSILTWRIPWTDEPGRSYSPWVRKELDTTEGLNNSYPQVGIHEDQ